MLPEDGGDDSGSAKPPAAQRTLRPTVMPAAGSRARDTTRPARSRATSASASPPPGPMTVSRPTAMPGVERQRIEVGSAELQALSPGSAPEVYQRARELVATFVVQKSADRKAILWGHDVQKAFAELVTETLALSQAPLLRKVDAYLVRMMDILGSIDLMAVCGHGGGGLGGLLRSVNSTIDTPEELSRAQAELDQIVAHLGVALDALLDLKDQLERQSSRVDAIGVEVEAAALAALFLSDHLQKDNAGLAQRLTERSMSLTRTLAQIRAGDPVRSLQLEEPIRMVSTVQNVALVLMPDFLGSVASALTVLGRGSLTPTQAGELRYQLRDILQQLQT